MTYSVPEEIAARIRRLPPAQQREALVYVAALERATAGESLRHFAGSIPAVDLATMVAAIEADCERVDARDW